jgi:hypothetical protein
MSNSAVTVIATQPGPPPSKTPHSEQTGAVVAGAVVVTANSMGAPGLLQPAGSTFLFISRRLDLQFYRLSHTVSSGVCLTNRVIS